MDRTKPIYGHLSVLLATVNLAIPPSADRLSVYPLATNSEAALWQFALVIVLGQLAVVALCVAWVVVVGLALRRRERYAWLSLIAFVINVAAVSWWVRTDTWWIAGGAA